MLARLFFFFLFLKAPEIFSSFTFPSAPYPRAFLCALIVFLCVYDCGL